MSTRTQIHRIAYACSIRDWVLGHPGHTEADFLAMIDRAEAKAQQAVKSTTERLNRRAETEPSHALD